MAGRRAHPAGISALTLLALVSVALGGQSIWALRVHQTTTYFTGMLTKAINAAASAQPGIGTSIRQIGALLAGAITSGAMLQRLTLKRQHTNLADGSGDHLGTTCHATR